MILYVYQKCEGDYYAKNRLIKRQKSYLKLAGIYYNADKDDYFFEEKKDFAGKIYMLNRKLKSLSTPVDTGEAKAPRELTADDFDALKSICVNH